MSGGVEAGFPTGKNVVDTAAQLAGSERNRERLLQKHLAKVGKVRPRLQPWLRRALAYRQELRPEGVQISSHNFLFWPKLLEELKPLNETRKLHFLQFIDGVCGTGGGTQAARR